MSATLTISPPARKFFEGIDLNHVYDEKVLALLTPEGFNDAVQFVFQNSETRKFEKDCYEEVEVIFEHWFGYRRYEDYNSYKSSYHQIKSRQKKKNRSPERLPIFPDYWPVGYHSPDNCDDE